MMRVNCSQFLAVILVTLTAALFGLQHLSAFALTSRDEGDILGNVLLSGISGFALAAYQLRFRWIWPLIFVHALADFTTTLAAEPLPDLLIGLSHILLLAFRIVLLRGLHKSPQTVAESAVRSLRCSADYETRTHDPLVAGSSPAGPTKQTCRPGVNRAGSGRGHVPPRTSRLPS
jgi:hypothetical protein